MASDLSALAAVLRLAFGAGFLEGHTNNGRFTVLLDVPMTDAGWQSIRLLSQVCDACEDELVLIAKAPKSQNRCRYEIVGKGEPDDLAIWLGQLAHRNTATDPLQADDTSDIGDETDEWS